jgi:16S rRNA (uracil1498-N3)-methyltransferase
VTRRRLHLPPDRISGGRADLGPEARHYLRDVLRLAPGAPVEVFDGRGGAYDATFDGAETLALGPRREVPPPAARVWLAFALSKGDKPELVVQKATELGVSRLLPFQARRSVVRLDAARAADRARRWRRVAEEAARQCGRSEVPEVSAPGTLDAALSAAPAGFARLLFHAGDGEELSALCAPGIEGYLAVVGPEGGLTATEVEAAVAGGCRLATLGPRVLRAETAAIAAAALVQFLAGDLR